MTYNFEAALGNIEKQRNGQPPEPTPPVTAPNSTALDTLGMSLQRAATANPQDEAKRRKLAGQLGMPQAILPPTADAESQAFLKNTNAQEIMAKYPALARWAQNGDNAAVAGKDLPALGEIESTAKGLPQIAQFGKNIAGSAAAAFPSANAAIWSFVQAAGSIISTNATKPLADTIGSPDVGEMLRTTALDMRQRATGIAKDLAPNTSDMGVLERGINSGVQSAVTSLMMLPLSVATGSPTPMLAGLSAITAGQALGEATDKGLPLDQALIHATKQGVIEYATELFPVGNLLKNLTLKTGLLKTATQFMVREGIGEQAATVLQDLDKWATLNPEKPFSEYLAERPEAALETLIATAVGGSIQVGGAKAVAKGIETLQRTTVVDLGRAQRAEENHTVLRGLGEQAGSHPLRERDPSAFHDFMSTMTEDGNLSDVYVDGKVLGDVLNQSGVNTQELAKKMPEVAQQLGEAAKTNGEVRISLADYATYVAGTDVEKGIIDHLRASPDGMTYTEAQQFYQGQKEDLSKQAEKIMSDANTPDTYKADVQAVHDNILEQMNKAGRFTPEVNAAYAVPFREFYAVQAAKLGIMPSELYKRLPLNFAPMSTGSILNQDDPVVRTIYRGTTGSQERIKGGIGEGLLFAAADEKTAKLYGENIEHIGVKQGAKVLVEGTAEFKKLTKRRGGKLLNSMRPGENLKTASDDAVAKAKEAGYDAVEFTSFKDLGIAIINEKAFVRNYGPNILNQSVFHGTPHVWAPEPGFPHGRPRLDKMGTGEGAQAFGWGWYSAEDKGVASSYRASVIPAGEKQFGLEDGPTKGIALLIAARGEKGEQMARSAYASQLGDKLEETIAAAKEAINNTSQLYSLDIPDSVLPRLLDWDKSLSEQSPEVREAMPKVGIASRGYKYDWRPELKMSEAYKQIVDDFSDKYVIAESQTVAQGDLEGKRSESRMVPNEKYGYFDSIKEAKAAFMRQMDPDLKNADDDFAAKHFDQQARNTGHFKITQLGYNRAPAAASEHLAKVGVLGNRYLDGGSRADGKGTYNYVIWDQPTLDKVALLERNGEKLDAMRELAQSSKEEPDFDSLYPKAGDTVDGRTVGEGVPNQSSIDSSIDNPEILPGIREISFSQFTEMGPLKYHSVTEEARTKALAEKIKQSGEIAPLIVVIDEKGPYVLEGGHRFDALREIGAKSFPAMVVLDLDALEAAGQVTLNQQNRAGYNPDTFTISLLKGADLSSTLHEGGHFYLEALADMAGRPDAPQQIKDDFRKTLDWFGITGNENLGAGVRGGDLGQSPLNGNFKKWFGDSKVVDADGKPLVVYHGTADAITEFRVGGTYREGHGKMMSGIYFSEYETTAQAYSRTAVNIKDVTKDHYGVVIPAYVSLKNPKFFEDINKFQKASREKLQAEGYDGAIRLNQFGDKVEVVAFSPAQIKSAVGNNGAFNPNDPNILNQGGEPGTPGDLPPGRTPEEVWANMSLDQQRPYHEQWAQSFERYMLEGKAPTTEMQPVFARFRAWMLNVYKSLEAFLKQNPLAGKLNDEVRGIFDRLIASEESIRATEAVRGYVPLFESSEAAGVTPKQFQDYIDLGEAATERAIDDLSARSLRDMKWLSNAKERAIKELQKEAKAKRKAVQDQVTTEVMSEPVNQARTFLKTGEMTDPATGDQIKAEAGFKLDKEAVAALFPKGGTVTLDMAKLRGMTADDGLSPELAAQMFGFSSGEALILELANGESAKEKIEGVTDQRMLEQYGELSSEEDIERAAEAAIHNEARARFLATGLAILAKSPIPAHQLNKAAKQAAEATIASRKVRDLRPAQYERAETKANKEAIQLAPKDPQGAIAAQRAALLNNRLAKASAEAVKEIEKVLRYVGKFQTEGTRKALDIEYMEQIDDLLRPFDFRKGQTLRQIDKSQSLADWIDQQEALGFEPAIDASLMDAAKLKSYKNMTVEELRGLVDSIKQIEHLGRLKNKLLKAKDEREFNAIVAEGIDAIEANANREVDERATPTDAIGIASKWWRQMTADHRKFASVMREMDGGKDNGFMFNHFLMGMNQSGDTETQMKANATDKLAALFKKIKKDPIPGNIYAKKRVVPGTNLSMSHEQRIMFAMNWGNEGNRQRLLDGGITGTRAISLPDAHAVLDTLTQEEWDFVQGVWDMIGEYKPQVAALERRLTGIEPKWIDAAPIQTKYGTYRGGYFPVKYDTELSSRSESLGAATDLRMGMKGAFNSAATRSGFTKARADSVINRPILLSYNAISQHVSEVTHRLSWQEWLVDSNRLLKALDNPIRAHYGAEILRTLRDTVVDIAAGDAPAKNGTEAAINRLRVGSTVVGMGWRVTTALLQPSGLAQSWARVGGRYMARGVYQFTKSPLTSSAFVNSKSKMMVDRGKTMQREINEVLNTVRAGEKISAFKASYFSMIGKMQRMVDIPTWLGAYEKAAEQLNLQNAADAKERTAIEEQAAALADQAVLDSQSGGQLKDLAKVQRGSPLQKIFTNFYSYFSATYNLNVEAVRRTNFKSPSQVAMLATDLVLLNSVPVLFSVALKELLKGECGDDLECLGKKLGHEQLNFMLGQMILLREAGVAIDTAAGGQGFGYQGPAGLRFFSDLYKLGQQTNQGDADIAFFKAANQVAGALLHYPAGQINATMEGVIAMEEGRVEGMGILPALIAGPPKK